MAADGSSQHPQPPHHQHALNNISSSPYFPSQRQEQQHNVTRTLSQQQVIGRAARQSYARQKLPMRVQSLAAYANNSNVGRLPQQGSSSSYQQRSSALSYGIPNSPPPRYELINRTQVPTLSSPPPPRHSSYGAISAAPPPPRHSSIPIRQDDEDFNFRGRPSSAHIQIKPASEEAYSPDSDEVSFAAQQAEFVAVGHGDGAIEKPLPKLSKSASTAESDRHIEMEVEKLAVRLQGESQTRAHARSSSVGIALQKTQSTKEPSSTSAKLKAIGERSKSFSYGTGENLATEAKQKQQRHQKRSIEQRPKPPNIYPALLSKVAMEMQKRVVVGDRTKDSIQYKDVFDGKEAVDKLIFLLRTSDRTLALLVGRSLYSQKLFHDVNYEHRLRDSNMELYQFRENLKAPYELNEQDDDVPLESPFPDDDNMILPPLPIEAAERQDMSYPNGVFTLLTNCYSPTCTKDAMCYSISCPRRMEKSKSDSSDKSLSRSMSRSSMHEKETELWIESVPIQVAESISNQERERQENIFELIYTERDFVRNLDYVQNFWIEPLISSDIIPDDRREFFVQEVFWNIRDIYNVNVELCDALLERQSESHVVERISDILLQHVGNFEPFVVYGSHQMVAKHMFELEKTRNPKFAEFVYETERKPESRKLELNGYLTKPTTRLGRYNLLLREILKHTPADNVDCEVIPRVMDIIKNFLARVNSETGKAENKFNLQLISERLSWKNPADGIDLKLLDSDRELVMKGKLKRKGAGSESSEVQVFLFDHYLVFAKIKYMPIGEHYKVYRRPIPLELLSATIPDNTAHKRASSILPYTRTALSGNSVYGLKASVSEVNLHNGGQSKTGGHAITFEHIGRKGSAPFTLYVPTMTQRRNWLEKIARQKEAITAKQRVFDMVTLSERQFISTNRVHHSATYEKQLVLAADNGVYVGGNKEGSTLTRILAIEKATQIEILEEYKLMFVLGDKTLWSFPLEALSNNDPALRRGRKISANVPFFHVGSCLNKVLVCVVRTNTLSATTIRTLEPSSVADGKKAKSPFSRLVRGNNDNLKVYKDLYLPSEASSINLLRTKMCIACSKGIEVVDMVSFEVQALLDPEDENLHFVFERQDVKPLAIYRIQFAEYLICYNEFAFYVDQKGRRKRTNWRIDWEGTPETFALQYPYILAFEPAFIEVRNIETGTLEQVIAGSNIRCVQNNSKENGIIHAVMDDPTTESFQCLFQLNLISR